MNIRLSDHFTTGKLLRFTLPSVIMMVFTSIYSVVDGLFISRYVGVEAMASISVVMPLLMVLGSFGFMLGSGGSAEVANTLGQGDVKKAKGYFTMLTISIFVIGILLSTSCLIFIRPICYFLGANDALIEHCVNYATICLIGNTFFMLQVFFQPFMITAEKPHLGLLLTILGGVTNIFLDWLFIGVFHWGLRGAAVATLCGYLLSSIVPILYFLVPNKSRLSFCKPKFYLKAFLHSAANGSSEMVSNISASITSFLFNTQLMRLAGETGVAAITIMQYVNFVFVAVLIGFSMGSAPVIGFHYGAGNIDELKNLFKKCLGIVLSVSVAMFIISEVFSKPILRAFSSGSAVLEQMTFSGFRIFALSFIVSGINIFASSFFTALCNGKASAAISFLRSLVLGAGMIMMLPFVFGIEGVWMAPVVSEFFTMVFSVYLLKKHKKEYGYT